MTALFFQLFLFLMMGVFFVYIVCLHGLFTCYFMCFHGDMTTVCNVCTNLSCVYVYFCEHAMCFVFFGNTMWKHICLLWSQLQCHIFMNMWCMYLCVFLWTQHETHTCCDVIVVNMDVRWHFFSNISLTWLKYCSKVLLFWWWECVLCILCDMCLHVISCVFMMTWPLCAIFLRTCCVFVFILMNMPCVCVFVC